MNITLFGGSFNPPTLGHEIVLDQIFKLKLIPGLDEIWLLPEYQHSFAKNSSLVEVHHRLEMTKFLLQPQVKISTACLDQKMSGNTIDHIKFLQKQYPVNKFSFLMGSDNLKTFYLWPKWQRLLKLMVFYVYPRRGFAFKPLYPNMIPLIHPRQKITNISSTMVRKKLEHGENCADLLPQAVAGYIKQKRLFSADGHNWNKGSSAV